jgi:hypothetical protein
MGGSWLRDNQTERAAQRVTDAVLIGFSVALTNERLGSSPPSPLQARTSSDDLVIVALINEHLTTLTPPPSTSPLSPLPARISSDDLVIVALTNENLTTITPDVLTHDHSSPLPAVLNGRHRRHSAASWVSKALLQRTDSATTRRLPTLPLLGEFASLEPSRTSAAYSARAQDLDDRPVQADSPTPSQPKKKTRLLASRYTRDSGATAALYQKTRLVHRDSARQHRRASPRRFFSF